MDKKYDHIDELGLRIIEDSGESFPSCSDEEKLAFSVPIVAGAVIGGLIGKKQRPWGPSEIDKLIENRNIVGTTAPAYIAPPKKEKPAVAGDYYSQANNLAKHLRVAFTPVSAIYLVKNGTKDVAIETIDTNKMDNEMYDAWKNKNQTFFKNMLINKMMMEINIAERMFARQAIQAQNNINNNIIKASGINKKASELESDYEDEYLDSIIKIRELYENPNMQKFAAALEDSVDVEKVIVVTPGFDGSPEKYASLGKVENVFGINSDTGKIRDLKRRLESPSYLNKHVAVGFLPNSVSFTVDNTLITTLNVLDMNHNGFEAFKNHDTKYFKKLFKSNIKGVVGGHEKKAAEAELVQDDVSASAAPISNIDAKTIKAPIATIFKMNGVSPVIYDMALTKKYGKTWTQIDMPAIIKMIEVDYNLNESGVSDIPLNKIMSIATCFSEDTLNAFHAPLAFEKIIRSFNDMPIDFLISETEGLGTNEIAYGLDTYYRLMQRSKIDAYELFSGEVLQYIAELLLSKDVVLFLPMTTAFVSDSSIEFYTELNRRILELIENRNNLDRLDTKFDTKEDKAAYEEMLYQNEILQPLTADVLDSIYNGRMSDKMASNEIVKLCEKHEFDASKETLLRRQVQTNLDIDSFIKSKDKIYNAQIALYHL